VNEEREMARSAYGCIYHFGKEINMWGAIIFGICIVALMLLLKHFGAKTKLNDSEKKF
jgi:hypothetical protein